MEADEQQVNLSRFSLLFPEKRDFFLENSGIFQFGTSFGGGGSSASGGRQNSPQDMRLFFSRQIGLSADGAAIPILGGTRLTGRTGVYSVGVLNIEQREQGKVPATNFTALRAQRDILANSDVGVILLNKDERGAAYNRVAGVDANFRFGLLSVSAYGVKTITPQAVLAGKGEDFAARGNFNYQSRSWLFRGAYDAIGTRFRDDMGFVPRIGVNHIAGYARWNVRPKWASKLRIREFGPHVHFDSFHRRDDGVLESRYHDSHIVVSMNNSGFFETGVNRNTEDNRAPFTLNGARGVKVQPGRYEFDEYFVLFRSDSARPFSFESRYSDGTLYDGYRRGYTFSPTFKVNEHFNASVGIQINDIDLPVASYVSKLVNTRVNYNFNTRLFLNALVQYNTDSRQWSSNVRFNFIHRPLSDLFLVYNERRLDGSGDLIDRALIAKMTYMVAF